MREGQQSDKCRQINCRGGGGAGGAQKKPCNKTGSCTPGEVSTTNTEVRPGPPPATTTSSTATETFGDRLPLLAGGALQWTA